MQRAPALCGVWGRVSVASLTLACAMRGDRDSNPGPSGHRRKHKLQFPNRDMASVNPEKRHSCKSTGWAISSGSSARWWPSRPWGTSCWWIYPCSQAEPSFCPCQSWGPGKKWILGKLHFHKLKSSRILRNNQSDSWVHYLRPHLPHVLEHHVTVAIKSTNPTK